MINASRTSVLLVIGSVVSGLAAAYIANNYVSKRSADIEAQIKRDYTPIEVIVPTRSILRGEVISGRNVALREIPRTFVHSDALRANQFGVARGRRALKALEAGDQILSFHVSAARASEFSSIIPEGKRALTIPVDKVSSLSGMLSPGDRVDLLATASRGEQARIFPIIKDVTILAAGSNVGDGLSGNESRFNTITIAVSPEDASKVLLAGEITRLTVVLREASDSRTDYEQTITGAELLGVEVMERQVRAQPVEMIIGGGR